MFSKNRGADIFSTSSDGSRFGVNSMNARCFAERFFQRISRDRRLRLGSFEKPGALPESSRNEAVGRSVQVGKLCSCSFQNGKIAVRIFPEIQKQTEFVARTLGHNGLEGRGASEAEVRERTSKAIQVNPAMVEDSLKFDLLRRPVQQPGMRHR